MPSVPTDIANNAAYLTLYNLSCKFSKKRGAKQKSLAIDCKCDYFLNTMTGKEIFITPDAFFIKLLPILDIKSLNILF